MNFKAPVFKAIRLIFFPFSIIYGLIVWCRNKGFDLNIFHSTKFDLPVICVGNLSLGGTGKTPMIEYLIRLTGSTHNTAIVSRGYKRSTKGFVLANSESTAREIGDEPMQFVKKFPSSTVVVGEKRADAIARLLQLRPRTDIVFLDDAFQHRAVTAGLNILLTDFHHRYTRDLLLPAGNLRDEKRSAKRAAVIVVTKCPGDLSTKTRQYVLDEIKPLPGQEVFFSHVTYGDPYHIESEETFSPAEGVSVLLVTGIADPAPLKLHLGNKHQIAELIFADHHPFVQDDINRIIKAFSVLKGPKIILTTEKDAVRLQAFKDELSRMPLYVIPIRSHFLFNDDKRFNRIIATFIKRFQYLNNKD